MIMRKFLIINLMAISYFIGCIVPCYAGNDPNNNENVTNNTELNSGLILNFVEPINLSSLNRASDGDTRLAIMNLQLDLMGIVFVGPIVALDFQFANMIAVGPYFRYNYAGLIYQGIITDWFYESTVVDPASYGIGLQAKFLIPIRSGKNRPYLGFGIEKFKGGESYDSGGTLGRHFWEYKANVYHFDFGYRLITDGSFNFTAGVSLGISQDTDNIDYYEYDELNVSYNTLETRFIPTIQVMLGWQIGPH